MDKARFRDILERQGYRVDKQATYPTVLVNGDKKVVADTYKAVKLLANKVGYTHTFGVKKTIETLVVEDLPEDTVDPAVKEYVENMPDSKEYEDE